MSMIGTWILLVEDEPFDPSKNSRVTFSPDGTVTMGLERLLKGTYEVDGKRLRADFSDESDGSAKFGAIIAEIDDNRIASISGSIYWSATGIPAGIGDIADPDDENADELWCDPCLLVNEQVAREQVGQ